MRSRSEELQPIMPAYRSVLVGSVAQSKEQSLLAINQTSATHNMLTNKHSGSRAAQTVIAKPIFLSAVLNLDGLCCCKWSFHIKHHTIVPTAYFATTLNLQLLLIISKMSLLRYFSPDSNAKPQSESPEAKKCQYDKQYDKTKRVRKFLPKWQIGRPWLIDSAAGMVCKLCTDNKDALSRQGLLKSRTFISGCVSYKAESISLHEKSSAHVQATKIIKRKEHPETAPAKIAQLQLHKANSEKLTLLFRNTHALAKHRKSFRDYLWLCELDEVKGLTLGKTYRNETSCRTFTKYIAESAKQDLTGQISKTNFFSITSDSSTDSSYTEQEIVFVRFVIGGKIYTEFAGITSPKSPDAEGIFNSIMESLSHVKVTESTITDKLVGFGCDGASVMVGKKGGVATFFKNLQPSVTIVHCLAHRLELSFKDSIKNIKLYDSCIVLLMGVYYFYRNSPKQRENLRNAFSSLKMKNIMPTRVGGTRWVGHVLLAVDCFLKGYKAIRTQMEDCVTQTTKVGEDGSVYFGDQYLPAQVHICLLPYLNDGPSLARFMQEEDKFQGFKLGGNVDHFGSTRTLLAKRILDALKKRYADLHDQAVPSLRITFIFCTDFGNDKVQTLCLHFKNTLEKAEVDTAEAEMEWLLLKSHLYNRYKDGVQELDWTEVHNAYLEGNRNILPLIDLIRTLPASSSENERGFSNMKQIKTDHRARIKTTTLDQLITIQMSTADIKNYDPEPAINQWIGGAKTSRRPTFMDGKEPKRARLESLDDNASEVREIIYDPENVCDNESDDFDSDFDDNEMSEEEVLRRLDIFMK
ncbi:Zinc finger protein 862 [Nymphon striatum]|nr:Zinc finger protein 862 [Nymphon striatum]